MSQLNVNKTKENEVVIEIQGEFDFRLHREFREAYKNTAKQTTFILDLTRTEYLDSAALGMLLLLREHAGGDQSHITIKQNNENFKKLFSITKFDKLFKIE